MQRHSALLSLLSCAIIAAGCAGAPPPAAPPAPQPEPIPVAPTAIAIARASADSARTPYTAADVRFMQMMVGHHAQAVVMSQMAPTHEASDAIQTLAARIISAQRDEIAIMQRWLAVRHQDVPDPEHVPHGEHAMHMPGMLTPAQLDSLHRSRGPDFERRYLRSMIAHHEGAVTMVTELFATDGAAQNQQVFKLASDVQVDQRTEIARMQRMLAALLFADADR